MVIKIVNSKIVQRQQVKFINNCTLLRYFLFLPFSLQFFPFNFFFFFIIVAHSYPQCSCSRFQMMTTQLWKKETYYSLASIYLDYGIHPCRKIRRKYIFLFTKCLFHSRTFIVQKYVHVSQRRRIKYRVQNANFDCDAQSA